MRRKALKIIPGVLLLWIAVFTADWVAVSCFDRAPIFCVRNDDGGHYSGVGYSYDMYPHPISGEYQYCLYVFGVSTISTFTD